MFFRVSVRSTTNVNVFTHTYMYYLYCVHNVFLHFYAYHNSTCTNVFTFYAVLSILCCEL